jgi:hypothetical protein
MHKPLVIYHGHCDDGFTAAWALRHALGDDACDFHLGIYQEAPPDVLGRDVIMVDFSYKRPVIEEMARTAHSILVIDHHKTAEEDLQAFPSMPTLTVQGWLARQAVHRKHPPDSFPRIAAFFDMKRSGAMLAWSLSHSADEPPAFVYYVQDRDLWRKALPNGDEFTIWVRSFPMTFPVWDSAVAHFETNPEAVFAEGRGIQRYYRQQVEASKREAYEATFCPGTTTFLIANAPYAFASEVAGELAVGPGYAFGACYFERADGKFQYSLRSRGDFDVSEIALAYGGGGHKNSAGFASDRIAHLRARV